MPVRPPPTTRTLCQEHYSGAACDSRDPGRSGQRADSYGSRAIAELYDLFRDLDRRIGLFDKKIDRIFHGSEACQRIARIKGVGPTGDRIFFVTPAIGSRRDGSEKDRQQA
jgi:hypothetical protein